MIRRLGTLLGLLGLITLLTQPLAACVMHEGSESAQGHADHNRDAAESIGHDHHAQERDPIEPCPHLIGCSLILFSPYSAESEAEFTAAARNEQPLRVLTGVGAKGIEPPPPKF